MRWNSYLAPSKQIYVQNEILSFGGMSHLALRNRYVTGPPRDLFDAAYFAAPILHQTLVKLQGIKLPRCDIGGRYPGIW